MYVLWKENNLDIMTKYFQINEYSRKSMKKNITKIHEILWKFKFLCMLRYEVIEEVTEKNVETADQSKILDVDEKDVTNDEHKL